MTMNKMNKMNKKFDLQTVAVSPYDVYQIGNIFHNNNGDDYIILNISAERDKVLLAKKLDKAESEIVHSPVFYIGAKGLWMNDWAHGHYFMSDFQAAWEWFMTDDNAEPEKKKGSTVEDVLKLYHEDDHTEYTFTNYSNFIRFKTVEEIPDYLKHAELEYFSVFGTYDSIDDMEFPHGRISFVLTDDIVILEIV